METAKLILSFLTPLVILLLGIWSKKIAAKHEKRLSLHDRIIENRVSIYEKIGKDLNDIYAFLTQVGDWKEFTPEDIIKKKRAVDKIMYVKRPYWSDKAFKAYSNFMNSGFETFTGVGEDAKLKTITWQFQSLPNWNNKWKKYFSEHGCDIKQIHTSYQFLMSEFSEQFGFIQE